MSHYKCYRHNYVRYYKRHRSKILEKHRLAKLNNESDPIAWRALLDKRNAARRLRYSRIKLEVHTTLGGCCMRCGISDPRLLQIDHVNNDGASERRTTPNSISVYKNIVRAGTKEALKRYQLLCANCHVLKHLIEVELADPSTELKFNIWPEDANNEHARRPSN